MLTYADLRGGDCDYKQLRDDLMTLLVYMLTYVC